MTTCAIVLANGRISDTNIVCGRLKDINYDLVIAADGGSHHADKLNLRIDVVVGDLDSLDDISQARLGAGGTHFETSSTQKDETDLELALLYALRQGVEKIAVLGAMGGRLDMSIANLLLLTHPRLVQAHIEIWSGDQTAWIIRPPGDEIQGKAGDTLSLIPLNGEARGVITENLAYSLKDETLHTGPSRGLSNVLISETASVQIREGNLLAVHTPGRA